MSTFAAVMTGKGTGPIATIQFFGEQAKNVLGKIFRPTATKPAKFKTGQIILGTITNGTETIDQVTIGCESPHSFAVNCHGNPLIVADIMKLLSQNDVTLLTAEQLLCKILSSQKNTNAIQIEAKLNQPKAKTLEGTKIIANQINAGLSRKAQSWLQNINSIPLDEITAEAETIIKNTQTAKLIIYGCKIALTGPPNTGKSTLLNYLAGKQKAIVTDIKGTTRDYVTAQCQIEPLSIEFIDTAGLDEKFSAKPESIERKSQQKAARILEDSDLVLLVLDNSQPADQLDDRLVEKIAGKLVLTVLNKSDLPAGFNADKLPQTLSNTVKISAKLGTAITDLIEKIRQITGVADFNPHAPVCITSRQEKLLKQLAAAKSKTHATSIITGLLNAKIDCHCEERSDEAI